MMEALVESRVPPPPVAVVSISDGKPCEAVLTGDANVLLPPLHLSSSNLSIATNVTLTDVTSTTSFSEKTGSVAAVGSKSTGMGSSATLSSSCGYDMVAGSWPSMEMGSSSGEADPPDHDSDVDLYKVMKITDMPPPPSVAAGEDEEDTDEEDDEFVVHFAHTGRKNSDNMTTQPELLMQISELQEAVVGMKGTLTEAVTRLSSVVEDPSITRELQESRQQCQDNTAEVLKLVLSLKTDITSLQKEVVAVSERQTSLQSSVSQLLEERRLLVADLSQAGVISLHTRSRLEAGGTGAVEGVVGIPARSGSGSHSNDSGVALLLERAHQAFNTDHTPSPTPTNQRTSDQESLPEQPSLLVPSSVYDYVAGLRSHAHPPSSAHSVPQHSDSTHNRQSVSATVGGDSEDLGLVYDSDSSLTIAANKTISLSASLSQQCGLELRSAHTAPHDHHHTHHHTHQTDQDRSHTRSDSDGSDQSRDAKHRHRRRSHEHGRESSDPYTIVVTRNRGSLLTDLRDPRETQRYRVARELLDTEKKYCKTLWTIQDTFADPLKKAGILSHKDITTLFPEEVYQLYDKHCLLQHQLRERLASWKWQPLVGDIVARFTDPRHTDVLRLYTAYVNDFPEVLKTFHKLCRTSQPFTKFIKACLEQPACGGLDLGAFLLTPVQRVPRYILLMKQLLKYTDPQHPDYQHLHACLERLRDFLARLNDSMEHSFQLVHAQLSPHGSVPGSSHHHPPPPPPPSSHHRSSRSPRRSSSSIGSPPFSPSSPTYSPDRVSNSRSAHTSPDGRQRSPSCSQSIESPQRSHSSATQPSCRPRSVFLDTRSSSLPRGSASSSSGSGGSAASPSTELPRIRSRSESVASRRPLPTHTHHPTQSLVIKDAPRSLVPAHSVVDVTAQSSPSHESGRWEDLAASEPSLNDPRPSLSISKDVSRPLNSSALTSAHSVHNVDGPQKQTSPVWTESSHPDDPRGKKKSSIRTSLKNMFTFKKSRPPRAHHHHHQHHHHSHHHHHSQPLRVGARGHEESDYWEGPSTPESTSTTQASPLSVVGDFVDEEGNPCSNV